MNPTNKVPVLKSLNHFKNSYIFYDIHDLRAYHYNDGDAGFKLNSYLLVYQKEKKIGTLTIGNSVKITRNLLSPGDLYFGDEGYILSWVYVDKSCAIRVSKKWKGNLSNTGTPLLVETNVICDLGFQRGWNLFKTEVIGPYHFSNTPEED